MKTVSLKSLPSILHWVAEYVWIYVKFSFFCTFWYIKYITSIISKAILYIMFNAKM